MRAGLRSAPSLFAQRNNLTGLLSRGPGEGRSLSRTGWHKRPFLAHAAAGGLSLQSRVVDRLTLSVMPWFRRSVPVCRHCM